MLFAAVGLGIGTCAYTMVAIGNQKSKEQEALPTAGQTALPLSAADAKGPVLSPSKFRLFELVKLTTTSHDTKLLRFALPNGVDLGLPIGRHLTVRAVIDGQKVMRPYTPCSLPSQKGFFELLIKEYELGRLTPHLCALAPGAKVEMRGPTGNFKYAPNMVKDFGFVCAGSGITPMIQIILAITHNENDHTNMSLLYQNREERDILLKTELDSLLEEHGREKGKLRAKYALSRAPKGWETSNSRHITGYITKASLQKDLPPPGPTTKIGICGPSGFNKSIVAALKQLGYSDTELKVF
jgi:cytochrome-b5 reductase